MGAAPSGSLQHSSLRQLGSFIFTPLSSACDSTGGVQDVLPINMALGKQQKQEDHCQLLLTFLPWSKSQNLATIFWLFQDPGLKTLIVEVPSTQRKMMPLSWNRQTQAKLVKWAFLSVMIYVVNLMGFPRKRISKMSGGQEVYFIFNNVKAWGVSKPIRKQKLVSSFICKKSYLCRVLYHTLSE